MSIEGKPNTQIRLPETSDVSVKYPPLMEGGVQANMRCFHCGHNVPLFLDGDKIFIAGHSYFEEEEYTTYEQAKQVGGESLIVPRTHSETEAKHCDGGSMKIIGIVEEDDDGKVLQSFTDFSKVPDGYRISGYRTADMTEMWATIRVKRKDEIK